MGIQLQVSDLKKFKSHSCNRTPTWSSPITWQIGARRINHDREFCYRYDYSLNCTPLGPITITYRDWLTQSTIYRPFAQSGHMLRNKLCWDANTPRTSPARLSLVLKVPLCNLRPSINLFRTYALWPDQFFMCLCCYWSWIWSCPPHPRSTFCSRRATNEENSQEWRQVPPPPPPLFSRSFPSFQNSSIFYCLDWRLGLKKS